MRDVDTYYERYTSEYGFESVLVRFRQRLLVERLNLRCPRTVVEIGCGSDLLLGAWIRGGGKPEKWIVVEPAAGFAGLARRAALANMEVVEDYFENSVDHVERLLGSKPDMILCSGLLHEVASPRKILSSIQQLMGLHSLLHVNVPNSESLHRRVAKSMGLISDTKALSSRNTSLLQHRVYDLPDLTSELVTSGFSISDRGGHLLKPFTHAQMEAIVPILGDSVMEGLYKIGAEMPDLATEIWLEATLDNEA